ncbi:YicC/YloC family endoribonuclease [Jeotgalibacillus sp. R-1-5s-1]|uniref:YicC/YloC family endoribonuclease n=1 Tax=Jeotgalibacillus sp. R-1-5s-1 TaxID=2555897 RepID=UPI00106A6D69|nr:YicC/YloC family endoribonuclease [Jeotgalibacillus sp. R-1-5s-1]TFE03548.1 YicC family protein [Jeotgalibacillus sp. R-1-5s-1]
MVTSMTGFGRGTAGHDSLEVTVEIKSVNHRFQECSVKIPRLYSGIEDRIKKMIGSTIKRGKVDVYVSFEGLRSGSHELSVDWALLDSFAAFAEEAKKRYNLQDELKLEHLFQQSELFSVTEKKESVNETEDIILQAAAQASAKLSVMRQNEGKELEKDLRFQVQSLRQIADEAKNKCPAVSRKYKDRLEKKMREYTNGEIDESKLLTEVAVFSEKADMTEEFTRLISHLSQFEQALEKHEPIGRRLDFLTQEMNREINTIGSKANDETIASAVIEMKSTLEKIREQVQNIE